MPVALDGRPITSWPGIAAVAITTTIQNMPSTLKLPAYPRRTITVALDDDQLDALDEIGVMTDTPRSALVREAVGLWLSMHESPLEMIAGILDGLGAIHGADAEDDRIGETKGTA